MDIEIVKSMVKVDSFFISFLFIFLALYYYGYSLHFYIKIKFQETLALIPDELTIYKMKARIYVSIALALTGIISVVMLVYPRLIIYLIENSKI